MKNQKIRQSNNEKLFIGLFIGLLIGVPFAFLGLDYLSDNVSTLTLLLLGAIFIVGISAFLVVIYRERLFKLLFGKVQTNFNSITEHGFEAINALTKGDSENARNNSKQFILEASAWYSWVNMRRWMLGAGIALIAAFAGLLGSVLLFRQNQLLSKQTELILDQNQLILNQNNKIDIQSYLLESQRRSGLIIELTSILESIPKENEVSTILIDGRVSLPQSIRGRIVALSRALRPYHYVNISSNGRWISGSPKSDLKDSISSPILTRRPLSPERGQLLLSLVNSNVYMPEIIEMQPDFSSADLQGVNINSVDLSFIDLKYSDFSGANLFNVNFSSAELDGANFERANLIGANFNSASCDEANYDESRLNNTNFEACYLANTTFYRAILFRTQLKGAILLKANLEGAIPDLTIDSGGEGVGREWLNQLESLKPPIERFEFNEWRMEKEMIYDHPFLDEDIEVWIVKKNNTTVPNN